MKTIKEQRDEWLADRGITVTPEKEIWWIRALLGLSPDHDLVTGVRILMQHGREKFAEVRGPRYDVINGKFAEWEPMPRAPFEQLPLV